MFGAIGPFAGVKIITDDTLVVPTGREDWSRVRSPGRARRRRHKHRQNITPIFEPSPNVYEVRGRNTFIMHPATARRMADTIKAQEPICQS